MMWREVKEYADVSNRTAGNARFDGPMVVEYQFCRKGWEREND